MEPSSLRYYIRLLEADQVRGMEGERQLLKVSQSKYALIAELSQQVKTLNDSDRCGTTSNIKARANTIYYVINYVFYTLVKSVQWIDSFENLGD